MIDAGNKNERAKLFPSSITIITFHTLVLSRIAISASHEMHFEIPYSLIKYQEKKSIHVVFQHDICAVRPPAVKWLGRWKFSDFYHYLSLPTDE